MDGSAKAHQHAISSFDCPLKERFAVKLELQMTVPGTVMGRVMGALGAATTLSAPLGALASGYVAAAIPLTPIFQAVALAFGLSLLLWAGIRSPSPASPDRDDRRRRGMMVRRP